MHNSIGKKQADIIANFLEKNLLDIKNRTIIFYIKYNITRFKFYFFSLNTWIYIFLFFIVVSLYLYIDYNNYFTFFFLKFNFLYISLSSIFVSFLIFFIGIRLQHYKYKNDKEAEIVKIVRKIQFNSNNLKKYFKSNDFSNHKFLTSNMEKYVNNTASLHYTLLELNIELIYIMKKYKFYTNFSSSSYLISLELILEMLKSSIEFQHKIIKNPHTNKEVLDRIILNESKILTFIEAYYLISEL